MTIMICTARLRAASPYSQSKAHDAEWLEKETPDAYDARTWREKAHVNDDGFVFIPAMALKKALDGAAKYIGDKVPGKKGATYTKHFVSGVFVVDGPTLPIRKEDLICEKLHMNSDGVSGSGKRVWRHFPVIKDWEADVEFNVADLTVTEDVFRQTLETAGLFKGIGRWRPENGGLYGRFTVVSTKWRKMA